jgi:hypothetical protein
MLLRYLKIHGHRHLFCLHNRQFVPGIKYNTWDTAKLMHGDESPANMWKSRNEFADDLPV